MGSTKGFINGKALSYEGHTHTEYAGISNDSVPFRYITTDTYSNKYYKINILSTANWMYAFTIRIYQNYTYYDIVISGYNYGANHWYSPAATLIGSTADSIQVHFGYDSDYNLWVAIPAGYYTGLVILNSANGYRAVDPTFSIALVDSLPSTVQTSVTAYRPANINDLNKYALSSTVNTLSSKISSLEANVDVATLVANGTFHTYGYDASSNSYEQGITFNHDSTTSSTIMKYYKSDLQSTTTATISSVACSFIVFKIVHESSLEKGVMRHIEEIKAKAGSEIRFSENDDTTTFAAKISNDGKTVIITKGYPHNNSSSNSGSTVYQKGWYECYA